MGNEETTLGAEEVEEIRTEFPQFEVKDVKRLFKRFKNIDRNHRGFVSRGDVLHLPEFAMNPLRGRLLDLFPAGDGGTINFRQFCQGLALFHPHAPLHDKFQFLFRLYDVDGDGTVSKADVEALLRIVGGKYVDEEKLHEYSESALFGKDSVTFEEFCAMIPPEEAIAKLSLSFERQL